MHDIPIEQTICFAGEIGLSGEVRSVSRIEQRIQEADRLGFEQIFISSHNLKGMKSNNYNIQIKDIKTVADLLHELFV